MSLPKFISIEIDGPRGSGKSTILNLIQKAIKDQGIEVIKVGETEGSEYLVVSLSNYKLAELIKEL